MNEELLSQFDDEDIEKLKELTMAITQNMSEEDRRKYMELSKKVKRYGR